ncbi:MAG: 1-acyl-sn-glycerol-3-phosphate acyltransferase [Bacteroidia bacterium]|nr:1-acyl-sn-glycerol-3-phosphate acyltransferase [Bacteroidia bacterium]
MLKNFLRQIFAIYALIAFIPTLVLAYLAYVLVINLSSGDKVLQRTHFVSSWWAKIYYSLIFIRIQIANHNMHAGSGVHVFVCNHRSLLDVPVWAYACMQPVRFLSKAELTKVPVFGYVLKRVYITVDRADKTDRLKSINKMKKTLDQGVSIFLAPEGTRNRSNKVLLDFKEGAFRLAVTAQVPIGILTLYNTDKLLSPSKLFSMQPGTIYGEWTVSVPTKGLTENDIPELKQRCMQIMETNYLQLKNKYQ